MVNTWTSFHLAHNLKLNSIRLLFQRLPDREIILYTKSTLLCNDGGAVGLGPGRGRVAQI
jgi:hypothetical protein